ncbi:MAG: methyl-accepting chemotaxis protein [Gemmatimonadales bacterium]|jgi:methyl-accepting chemotaxis protein
MSLRLKRFDTIRARVIAGLAALIAGILVIALIGIAALRTLGTTVSRELAALTQTSQMTNALVATVFDELRSAEQYLTVRSAAARETFHAAGERAYELQSDLRRLPDLSETDHLMLARIARLQAEVETWYSLAHAHRDLGRRADADAVALRVREPTEELLSTVQAFSAVRRTEADQSAAMLETTSRERRRWVWTVLVASILIAVGVGAATVRSVERPLARLEVAARRFADGDLRPVTLGAMPAELETLGSAMMRVTTTLRGLVSDVVAEGERIAATASDLSAVSEQLAATAGEVSTAMVEIAGGAERQVSDLEQSAQAIDTMQHVASESRATGERVSSQGAGIHRLAQRNRDDVQAAGNALLEFGELIERGAGQVEELERVSDAIYDFVELIKSISSQTNLLALNAAIEAARAGERGVGFAVVAEEVRELADSSADAAERVSQVVASIRHQMEDLAQTMAAGRTRVSGVESVAQAAARALDEIVRAVADIEEAAHAVEREAVANLEAAERISQAVRNAQQAAHAHASSSEEVTAAAEEQGASTEEMAAQAAALSEAADRLRALVKEFRL